MYTASGMDVRWREVESGMTRPNAGEHPRIPDSAPRTPHPAPRTPDPGPRAPDPGPRTPDPGPGHGARPWLPAPGPLAWS
ncbi:hypothetical protein GCM10010498_63500 [Streptomyces cavourensis]|nr:hypothetical protein GCM10010498_63500 [Streptomyces cavourensis]